MLLDEDLAGDSWWEGHLLLLHQTESERRAGLAAWVRRGLDRDEKVICVESEDEPPQRSVLAVLREHGIDGEAAVAEQRLQVVPVPDFYPSGYRSMVDSALSDGFGAVRISTEAKAVLNRLDVDTYARIERDVDRLSRTHSVSALCQCDDTSIPEGWLPQTIALHSGGMRSWQLHTTGDGAGVSLAGEINASNDALLAKVLSAATSGSDETLRLDLSRVPFLSVSGARAVMRGTQQFRDRGGHVLVLSPQPMVRRVLLAMGFDRLSHVEMLETRT